jgi:importin-4
MSSNIVRHAIARVIAAIASLELPVNNWPALLPFLSEACNSNQVNARATGIYILFTLLENSTEGFLEHLDSLYELCGKLLDDPESLEIQVTSVRTLGTLAQYIEIDEKDQIVRFINVILLSPRSN